MGKLEEGSNKEGGKLEIKSLPEAIQSLFYIASCLGKGDSFNLHLDSTSGVLSRKELVELEKACSDRRTVDVDRRDPPLYLSFMRAKTGGQVFLRLLRWSASEGKWNTPLFVLKGDSFCQEGELTNPGGDEALEKNIMPILQKISDKQKELGTLITKDHPNRLLFRTWFATDPSDAFWLQLASPSKLGHNSKHDYRVYVNPRISSLDEYGKLVVRIVELARQYQGCGLEFKVMNAGEGDPGVIMDPHATKIVFYFGWDQDAEKDGAKKKAIEFANHLSGLLKDVQGNSDVIKEFTPQQEWNNGLVVLGKETREERENAVYIAQKALRNGGEIGPDLAALLGKYSIPVQGVKDLL